MSKYNSPMLYHAAVVTGAEIIAAVSFGVWQDSAAAGAFLYAAMHWATMLVMKLCEDARDE